MGLIGSKPLASLSSGLLARKGHAKPAMRPQLFNPAAAPLDDLGWNDMGPAPASAVEEALPPVLVERDALAARMEEPAPETVLTIAPAMQVGIAPAVEVGIAPAVAAEIGRESAAQTARGKAAFTLRLDPSRHLRLRLASAVTHRSAQAVVAEALDRFLATMPEVEALAARLPAEKAIR